MRGDHTVGGGITTSDPEAALIHFETAFNDLR
jgi:hypothetical protein